MSIYIYMLFYRERERETDRKPGMFLGWCFSSAILSKPTTNNNNNDN